MNELYLKPMNAEQLTELIDSCKDGDLKTAYGEMLDGVSTHKNNFLWYTYWQIVLKSENKEIGGICFKGEPVDNIVEIGYGIDEKYRGNGYATLAVKQICTWVYQQNPNIIIRAQTDSDNIASQKVLQNNGFKKIGVGDEGLMFEKKY